MKNHSTMRLILSGLFMAVALVLPFFTGQIPQIGKMLLPMHIPVMLCGIFCGWKYGIFVGATSPILRSLIFSVPVMYPTAIAMSFELATYGFVTGFLYSKTHYKGIKKIYFSIIPAMIIGRIVAGLVKAVLYSFGSNAFTFDIFIMGTFVNTIPSIIIQLILMPILVIALRKTKIGTLQKDYK